MRDGLRGKSTPAQSLAIDTEWLRGIAGHRHIRRHILRENGRDAHEAVSTNMHELMHAGKAAENGVIADMHMACQLDAVGEHDVVADLAIVCDVNVGHDPIIITDARDADVLRRAAIDRAEFSNGVAIADF